jgi:hypothetical protein
MTTLFHDTEVCAVCGHSHTIHGLASTNSMGPCDLDSRPAEMKRSTMEYWVQQCPSCGYCAASTSEAADGIAEVVRGQPYQSLLQQTQLDPTGRKFLLQRLIATEQSKLADAFWACLHAAWAFDDANDPEQATRCRTTAEQLARDAANAGEVIAEQTGISELIRADLLRRVGHFKPALVVAETGLHAQCEDNIKKILAYEISLIKAGDRDCHDIGAAFNQ